MYHAMTLAGPGQGLADDRNGLYQYLLYGLELRRVLIPLDTDVFRHQLELRRPARTQD